MRPMGFATATAISMVLATGALAQSDQAPAPENDTRVDRVTGTVSANGRSWSQGDFVTATGGQTMASALIGKAIYNADTPEGEPIGTIRDIVLARDGSSQAALIDVSRYLGERDRLVAVDLSRLEQNNKGDMTEARLALNITRENLENAPPFETDEIAATTGPAGGAGDEQAPAASTQARAPGDGSRPAANGNAAERQDDRGSDGSQSNGSETAARAENNGYGGRGDDAPATAGRDRNGSDRTAVASGTDRPAQHAVTGTQTRTGDYGATGRSENRADMELLDIGEVSADELIGTTVYDANQEDIGEIGDVLIEPEGKVRAFVVDVGGFLGIGDKEVAMDAANIEIRRQRDDDLAVFTAFNERQLEAQPEYDPEGFRSNPDAMLMR